MKFQDITLRPRLVRGIKTMGKETQPFPVFGMQKERKYFPGGRENRGEIGSFPSSRESFSLLVFLHLLHQFNIYCITFTTKIIIFEIININLVYYIIIFDSFPQCYQTLERKGSGNFSFPFLWKKKGIDFLSFPFREPNEA